MTLMGYIILSVILIELYYWFYWFPRHWDETKEGQDIKYYLETMTVYKMRIK